MTIFGPGDAGEPTVSDWATWSNTIEHEIVTRVGCRVARVRRMLEISEAEADAAAAGE